MGLGVGVGVVAAVEPEALTAPPPQPTATKRREQNRTKPTIFGPMVTVSCTQRSWMQQSCWVLGHMQFVGLANLALKTRTGPVKEPVLKMKDNQRLAEKVLLEKLSHGWGYG